MARKTHEIFIKEALEKLGDAYTILTLYKDSKTKVKVKHSCGHVYECTPDKITSRGQKCPKCFSRHKTKLKNAKEAFPEKFDKISEGKYVLLNEYNGLSSYLTLRHLECGNVYDVRAGNFLSGKKCPRCMDVQRASKRTIDEEEILKRLNEKFNGKICLLSKFSGLRRISEFKCKDCDLLFKTKPGTILSRQVRWGCPNCSKKISSGENKIREFLDEVGCIYEMQYSFSDLTHKNLLKFDFAVFDFSDESSLRFLVEFDGRQHFIPVEKFGGEDALESTILRDTLKDKYCSDNGIKLIRIPYWEFDDINRILEREVSGL
jgi:hypothetical protein